MFAKSKSSDSKMSTLGYLSVLAFVTVYKTGEAVTNVKNHLTK